MKINIGETLAAGAVVLFGLGMAAVGASYPVGTLSQMGPGYFPVIVGLFTALLGAATLVSVLGSDIPAPAVSWRASFLVFFGVFAWAMLAERLGLVAACVALMVATTVARPPINAKTLAITTAIVTVAAWLLFVEGFGLPLRAFKW